MPVPVSGARASINSTSSSSSSDLIMSSTATAATTASSADVVRIAVTNACSPSSSSSAQNLFRQFNLKTPLAILIEELCRDWKLFPSDDYGLKFETSKSYVTEKSKSDVRNGSILKLCQSPRKIVNDVLKILNHNTDPQMQLTSLKALQEMASDYAVAFELVRVGGLEMVVGKVSEPDASAQKISHLISIFYEIMKHEDLVAWDDDRITPGFVARVADNIETETSMLALKLDERTQQACLAILEALVCTKSKYDAAQQRVSISSLLNFFQADNALVQQNALALFNALFRLGDKPKRMRMKQTMERLKTREVIVNYILHKQPSEEMRHQLYVLQTLLLNLLEERMYTVIDSQDQKALEKIKELRRTAFDLTGMSAMPPSASSNASQQRTRYGEDYKKLGFKNGVDPTEDFRQTPPGVLALDMMASFARNHTEEYTKVVLENSYRTDQHECPFVQTSIEIVKIMCEVIRIGEVPKDQGVFYPMFFTHENPLEEMFSITIQHVNKTWREMRATSEDFRKVIDVAREQIVGALKTAPPTMDEYKRGLKTYNEISEGRKEEAKSRGEREGRAVQHLRATLTPETLELIQRQRLNFLVGGTKFNKYKREGGGKERGKYVFCRLSPNHKAFYHGEWAEESAVATANAGAAGAGTGAATATAASPTKLENLPNKLPVAEIRDFLVGPACPHVKDSNKRNRGGGGGGAGGAGDRSTSDSLAFSFVKENGDTLDFVAPDAKTFDFWCDGVNTLLRRDMRSQKATEDLEMLLAMEVKIRLLDIEGIDIPDEAPPLPPTPPANFNLCQEV